MIRFVSTQRQRSLDELDPKTLIEQASRSFLLARKFLAIFHRVRFLPQKMSQSELMQLKVLVRLKEVIELLEPLRLIELMTLLS